MVVLTVLPLLPLEEYLVFFLLAAFTAALFFRSPLLPGFLFLLLWTPAVLLQQQQQQHQQQVGAGAHHNNGTIPLLHPPDVAAPPGPPIPPAQLLHVWLSGLYAAGIGLFLGAAITHAMDLPMLVDGALFPMHPQAQRRAIPEVFLTVVLLACWSVAGTPRALWRGGHIAPLTTLSLLSLLFLLWLLNSRHDALTKRQNAKYLAVLLLYAVLPLALNALLAGHVQATGGSAALVQSRPWRLLIQLPLVVLLARLFYLVAGHLSLRCGPGRSGWLHEGGFLAGGRAPDRVQHEYVALLFGLVLAGVHVTFLVLYWLLHSVVVVVVAGGGGGGSGESGGGSNHAAHWVHLHVMAATALLLALNAWLVAAQRHVVDLGGPGEGGGGGREMTGWLALIVRLDRFRREQQGDWADLQPIMCCGGGGGGDSDGDGDGDGGAGGERHRNAVVIAVEGGASPAFMARPGGRRYIQQHQQQQQQTTPPRLPTSIRPPRSPHRSIAKQ